MGLDVKKTGQVSEMEFKDEEERERESWRCVSVSERKRKRETPLGNKNRILQLLKI